MREIATPTREKQRAMDGAVVVVAEGTCVWVRGFGAPVQRRLQRLLNTLVAAF